METFNDKVESKVAASRLWKAAFEDGHNFLPKAMPHVVSKVEYEGGTGLTAGIIRTTHFNKENAEKMAQEKQMGPPVLFVKEKLVEVDSANMVTNSEVVEGGFLGVLVKRYLTTIRVQPNEPGSIVHLTFQYEPISESTKAIVPLAIKESLSLGFNDLDDYLLSNPTTYSE